MLSRKIFEILYFMMASSVHPEQVLRQMVFEFFVLNFEVFKNTGMMQFLNMFLIIVYRYKAQELLLSKRFEIMEKLYSSKAFCIVEKGPPPLDPPLTHLVTVGTEITAPHKQQVPYRVTVAAVQLRFH